MAEVQRSQCFLDDIAPVAAGVPSLTASLSWPSWARFYQVQVSTGGQIVVTLAKDKGSIGTSNPAKYQAGQVNGPDSSPWWGLPSTGQLQLQNFGQSCNIVIIYVDSLGG